MTLRAFVAWMTLVAVGSTPAANLEQGIALYWSGRYAETIEILELAQKTDLRDDEQIECLKYLGFSQVAVGDNDAARKVFADLLAQDPRHILDKEVVSPKIVKVFESARSELIESLFQQGKATYFEKQYAATRRTMNRILALDPAHALAKEYSQLASEQEVLIKKTAALEGERQVLSPSPAEPDDRIYHQTGGITPPVLTSSVNPKYPASARRSGKQGTVVMTVVIGSRGSVQEVTIVRPLSPALDRAAVAAVKRWRYRPATKDGRAVAVYSVVNLQFRLDR